MCSNAGGTSQNPLCGCQKVTAVDCPDNGHRFAASRTIMAAHKKITAADYLPEEGKSVYEKKLIYRNGKAA